MFKLEEKVMTNLFLATIKAVVLVAAVCVLRPAHAISADLDQHPTEVEAIGLLVTATNVLGVKNPVSYAVSEVTVCTTADSANKFAELARSRQRNGDKNALTPYGRDWECFSEFDVWLISSRIAKREGGDDVFVHKVFLVEIDEVSDRDGLLTKVHAGFVVTTEDSMKNNWTNHLSN